MARHEESLPRHFICYDAMPEYDASGWSLCLTSRWLVDDDIQSCFKTALICAISLQYEHPKC